MHFWGFVKIIISEIGKINSIILVIKISNGRVPKKTVIYLKHRFIQEI
jgi:hypothetical protein